MCGENQVCKKHGRGKLCLCKTEFKKICKTNENDCDRYKKDSFICECPVGWIGPTCSDDVNECLQNRCQNSAVCTNSNGSYSCSCTEGWTGKDCDTDIDECANQTCNDSLICHNKPGSFSCDAPNVKRGISLLNIFIFPGQEMSLIILIVYIEWLERKKAMCMYM